MTRLNIPLFIALAASILAAADGRTNTLPHQRMIRKRAPGSFNALPRWEGLQERADLLPGLGGNNEPSETASASASRTTSAAAGSATASSTRAATTTTPAAEQTSSSAAAASNTASSSTQVSQSASTTSGGLLDSLTGLLGGTSTSSTVSSTSTTSSSSVATTSSASSAAPATSQPPKTTSTPTLNIATPPPVSASASAGVTIVTSIAPEAVASQQAEQKARTAKITKNTIISLVVVASCIGGAVAIWTVIRKWKLSPSERFDDRMQPIDWAPTGGAGGVREETIEEKRHRRAGSAGSHGSFTSGGVGQSELGHGANGARSVYSDHAGHNMQQAQDFPPAHDFTAGAGNYGQYHQGQQQYGYADLQRGPSVTESNYSNGASVTRGLSYSRGHGGYEAQPGAGGVPPLPNPYGGGYEYEDYGRQQGQGQAQGQYRGY